jgi:hypothetical protein
VRYGVRMRRAPMQIGNSLLRGGTKAPPYTGGTP